ncbi:MAG: hypothetical protein OEY14_03110, partial [Myxococcales bacterium]|nr:hypothetical protein [Myxococcales bacterium]
MPPLLPLALAMLLGAPAPARAADTEPTSQSLTTVVLAVLLVGAAYLLAHFVVDRLQRRFLVVTGAEYLFLGILLGPMVPEIPAFRDLTGVMPVIALAAGWVGLLRGMSFRFRALATSLPELTTRIVLLHHLVPGIAVGLAAYSFLGLGWLGALSGREQALASAVLGCCAAADATAPFDLLARRYRIGGQTAPMLRDAARLGDVLVIFVFGLVFCYFHPSVEGAAVDLRAAEWFLISLLLGGALGLLFTPFLGGDESGNARFLALVGIIGFTSGAAYFLELSPLFVNLILGVVLTNTARARLKIRQTLDGTERPMVLVLLILAGALWRPSDTGTTLALLGLFASLRFVGKWVGSKIAAFGTTLRSDLYRGLLAHGEITVAMAVSMRVFFEGAAVDAAYTAILLSVVLHDLISPRML